jgi:hypothetical protein
VFVGTFARIASPSGVMTQTSVKVLAACQCVFSEGSWANDSDSQGGYVQAWWYYRIQYNEEAPQSTYPPTSTPNLYPGAIP